MSDESRELQTEELEELQLKNQLAALDLKWQLERRRNTVNGKYVWWLPTRGAAIIASLALPGFSCYLLAVLSHQSGLATLALVVLCGVLLIYAGNSIVQFKRYRDAEDRYQAAREAILRRLIGA